MHSTIHVHSTLVLHCFYQRANCLQNIQLPFSKCFVIHNVDNDILNRTVFRESIEFASHALWLYGTLHHLVCVCVSDSMLVVFSCYCRLGVVRHTPWEQGLMWLCYQKKKVTTPFPTHVIYFFTGSSYSLLISFSFSSSSFSSFPLPLSTLLAFLISHHTLVSLFCFCMNSTSGCYATHVFGLASLRKPHIDRDNCVYVCGYHWLAFVNFVAPWFLRFMHVCAHPGSPHNVIHLLVLSVSSHIQAWCPELWSTCLMVLKRGRRQPMTRALLHHSLTSQCSFLSCIMKRLRTCSTLPEIQWCVIIIYISKNFSEGL